MIQETDFRLWNPILLIQKISYMECLQFLMSWWMNLFNKPQTLLTKIISKNINLWKRLRLLSWRFRRTCKTIKNLIFNILMILFIKSVKKFLVIRMLLKILKLTIMETYWNSKMIIRLHQMKMINKSSWWDLTLSLLLQQWDSVPTTTVMAIFTKEVVLENRKLWMKILKISSN